ncbi:MAG: hypothetical protein ACRYGP_00665 [Janthinobacterium lividum]
MRRRIARPPVRLVSGAALLALLLSPSQVPAQSAGQPATAPADMAQHRATRVLAVGSLTAKATGASLPPVLEREVPATLALYLAGKIDAWYAKPDQTGVVFILDVATVAEARALLDPLPLGQAGMMTFDLTPIGPLQPLGLLLRRPAP